MNAAEARYRAGACNIGEAEVRRRWRAGWGGAAMTVILWVGFAFANLAAPWYWLLALPAFGAAVGIVQARSRFCVHFGLRRRLNFGDLGSTTQVEDAADRSLDRRRSWQLLGVSAAIAIVVATLGVLTA